MKKEVHCKKTIANWRQTVWWSDKQLKIQSEVSQLLNIFFQWLRGQSQPISQSIRQADLTHTERKQPILAFVLVPSLRLTLPLPPLCCAESSLPVAVGASELLNCTMEVVYS